MAIDEYSQKRSTKSPAIVGLFCARMLLTAYAIASTVSSTKRTTEQDEMKKPFRQLPYGERFRMPDHSHIIMVKIGRNLVADWPVTLYNHKGEPIQSICCWCHDTLNGDEDEVSLETEVEIVP